MFTPQELFHALAVPFLVSGAIAALAAWIGRWWLFPLAAGGGFLAGYALFGIPRLPPRDGTDWLFWIAIPLTLLAAASGRFCDRRWFFLLGLLAGPAAFVLIWPLTPLAVPTSAALFAAGCLAPAGALLVLISQSTEKRLGPAPVLFAHAIVLFGAAVIVLCFNLRIVGIYGLSAFAAGLPLAFLTLFRPTNSPSATMISIYTTPLLVSLLTGGRYYPDPGVPWLQFMLLLATPAILIVGLPFSTRHKRLASALSIFAVFAAVLGITIPPALAAKKAAEADPYSTYLTEN